MTRETTDTIRAATVRYFSAEVMGQGEAGWYVDTKTRERKNVGGLFSQGAIHGPYTKAEAEAKARDLTIR